MSCSYTLNGGGRSQSFVVKIMNLYIQNMLSMNYDFSKYFLFFLWMRNGIMKNE